MAIPFQLHKTGPKIHQRNPFSMSDSLIGSQPAGLAALTQDALQRSNAPSDPNSSPSDSPAAT